LYSLESQVIREVEILGDKNHQTPGIDLMRETDLTFFKLLLINFYILMELSAFTQWTPGSVADAKRFSKKKFFSQTFITLNLR